jgi:hypothetical protein
MRRTILALTMLAGFAALTGPAVASAYCDGYQAGYKAGFCAQKSPCWGGTPSGCPASNYALNTFQEGYDRGYRDGATAARRSN